MQLAGLLKYITEGSYQPMSSSDGLPRASLARVAVWSHDLHRCTGTANDFENQELDLFKILIRTGGYHPRHGLPGRLQDRKPRPTCKSLVHTETPIHTAPVQGRLRNADVQQLTPAGLQADHEC